MNYRESLVKLLKPINPGSGAEIGVHKGSLSKVLLDSFPDLHLYMVDPYLPHPQYPDQEANKRRADEQTPDEKRAHKLYMPSSSAAVSPLVAPELDFVFIDADHEEKSVYDDMEMWWPRVRYGGLVSGHDFGKEDIPGVTKAVEKWFSERGLEFSVAEGHIWWCKKPVIEAWS